MCQAVDTSTNQNIFHQDRLSIGGEGTRLPHLVSSDKTLRRRIECISLLPWCILHAAESPPFSNSISSPRLAARFQVVCVDFGRLVAGKEVRREATGLFTTGRLSRSSSGVHIQCPKMSEYSCRQAWPWRLSCSTAVLRTSPFRPVLQAMLPSGHFHIYICRERRRVLPSLSLGKPEGNLIWVAPFTVRAR